MSEQIATILSWLLVIMLVCLTLAVTVLWLIWQRLRNLNVPPDAGFFETMHYLPIALPIALDLLDFGLDILAAPVSWLLLDRLGLRGLRNKAAVEALIPLTQPIPVFTLGWFIARLTGLGKTILEEQRQ
ncbi:MAG TPA: hypothetical protein DEF43_09405 [Chloroflexus aurantiacus]|jgi:hypothetical protein|uniref:Uncharacterized protein n=1 Tax=Chloroflexus aurantiacus (strain ATCC 29366 / DSM 635 / J-10-fl) TaxID=324602 RepID=A9WAC1_CHLAA|nr:MULTISPECIES: hypothetical protein [Chloroflexus]ABY34680.1 hypothetical protein Caur_1452 [Chloroflexus aurantiacus J-10-fl]RMG52677.1 MAG: hypothetical protein D6716_02910 [Chloroflexota bacterium]HBW67360.1 hypothetical protein [Chloroflexus aurantiacus]